MKSHVQFLGGTGSVTGANFLLRSLPHEEGKDILIDCGLFQGGKYAETGNYEDFPFNPKDIQILLVTHAHIDHIGRIPKLVRMGFTGKIYSTEATKALAEPLLMDSVELLERDAAHEKREPIYTEGDVHAAFKLWEGKSYEEVLDLGQGYKMRFLDAGHILGSSMVEIVREGRKIVFTGDVGNDHSLLVGPVAHVDDTNYLVMESVYGDKKQEGVENRTRDLEQVIEKTIARGGTLLIPAFSTERTQDLIFELRTLMLEKRVPSVPVYVDSPLASRITAAFTSHPKYFREEIRNRIAAGEDIFAFPELRFVASSEESSELHTDPSPKIILAGSGMSQGGRVISHHRAYLPDARNTILIVGYQAAGSLGRHLIENEKEVRVGRDFVPVKAHIEKIYGYSAHRDSDGLLSLVHRSAGTLEQVFVVMGEPKSSLYLVQHIRDFIGTPATAPEKDAKVILEL